MQEVDSENPNFTRKKNETQSSLKLFYRKFTATPFAFDPKKDMIVFNGKYVPTVLVEAKKMLDHNTIYPWLLLPKVPHALDLVSERMAMAMFLQSLKSVLVILSESLVDFWLLYMLQYRSFVDEMYHQISLIMCIFV